MQRNKVMAFRILKVVVDNSADAGILRQTIIDTYWANYGSGTIDEEPLGLLDYHIELLHGAGFLACQPDDDGIFEDDILWVTWAGHDLLEENEHHI